MKFIETAHFEEGVRALADRIGRPLMNGSKVLWLIPGGSNIPLAVEAMEMIRKAVPSASLGNLTISQTDERYGPVGHPDSNWKQLEDAGIDTSDVATFPVLTGTPLDETVAHFGGTIGRLINSCDVIIGQFGMGADGHIAGILPHSPAIAEKSLTVGYESAPFTRISLTFPALRHIDFGHLFVSRSGKESAIARLQDDGLSLDDQPAQILKEMPEACAYILN